MENYLEKRIELLQNVYNEIGDNAPRSGEIWGRLEENKEALLFLQTGKSLYSMPVENNVHTCPLGQTWNGARCVDDLPK